jgi:hypothetical protein
MGLPRFARNDTLPFCHCEARQCRSNLCGEAMMPNSLDNGSLMNQATTKMRGICSNLGESDKISTSKTGDEYDPCREDIS